MPHDFSEVKKRLVGGLWLNTIVRAGSIRYPKRTRNKQMTMLSLTNEDELSEIYLLLSRKIIVKEGVLAWNYSLFKVMRMETEGVSAVGKSRYEKSMCTATDETKAFFPREIINLDFTSQDPQDTDGRIENELESVEETIKIQSGYVASEKEVFAMIYRVSQGNDAGGCLQFLKLSGGCQRVFASWRCPAAVLPVFAAVYLLRGGFPAKMQR